MIVPRRTEDVRPPVMGGGKPNRNTPLRYDWQHTHKPGYPRGYFARVNESLVLNVHRIREGSPTWEFLVVGFDLTQTTAPVIVEMGQAGTMLEGKLLAESKVPAGSPHIGQQPMFNEEKGLPF